MMRKIQVKRATISGRVAMTAACVLFFAVSSTALAGIAFQYDEITEDIVSASFSVDLAAMNAHRSIGENEMNFVLLVDCNPGGGLLDFDLSDDLFGVASPPDAPLIDMGPLETGIVSVGIDASVYPALAGGNVGLWALFTDTVDAMFAMDFISLTIETASDTTESFYGWPVGNENNGFGIGIPDGGDLPSPLPDSIPAGATVTGFDETISSKSILAIPEPATLSLLLFGGIVALSRKR